MARDVKLTTGGALRLRTYDESGRPELVEVARNVALRAQFVRYQYLTTDTDEEYFCAVFKDPHSGEFYGQPTDEN